MSLQNGIRTRTIIFSWPQLQGDYVETSEVRSQTVSQSLKSAHKPSYSEVSQWPVIHQMKSTFSILFNVVKLSTQCSSSVSFYKKKIMTLIYMFNLSQKHYDVYNTCTLTRLPFDCCKQISVFFFSFTSHVSKLALKMTYIIGNALL